eukprot:CAMPEP_0197471166 /NCGR_PEP_ID=MMETSP1309-20131121/2055_1 /TAXON_ID=464262 /ORGANISM="Genus nov. species nov., Strain RCC998" /LENGTH=280 /DNA_ID=CAMNT_0043008669 /DNA_START=58 /DNA_END=897 /DNA_ORIENTATION=+
MSTLERYAVALYKVSAGVDPVVLIWTATFALALLYFLLSYLLQPFISTRGNGQGGGAGGGRRRDESNASNGSNAREQSNTTAARESNFHHFSGSASGSGLGNSRKNWEQEERILSDVSAEVRGFYETSRRKFGHVKRVTIATAGVIFKERESDELRKSATLVPNAKSLVESLSLFSDVYLVNHVLDDASAKRVMSALTAGGLCGGGGREENAAPVKSHKVLFCEKHVSKVSIARQIEPDVHVDAEKATVKELQRFLPKVLFIDSSSSKDSIQQKPNVVIA